LRWKAVVFDLDDTIFREADYVRSGFRAVADLLGRTHGLPAEDVHRRLVSMFEAGVRGNTFDLLLGELGVSDVDAARLIEEYRSHDPEIRPFPGVPELLHSLSGKVPLGLVSDGYLEVQRRKLAALGLGELFRAVVFTDELGREHWKPHPLPFRTVLERLGVEGEEAVYVADNPTKDFFGARSVGMFTVQCRHSGGDYCGLQAPSPLHAPDAVAETLADLFSLLGADQRSGTGAGPEISELLHR
jgi:putative hydrolase of the HAD superfamily